MKKANKNKAFVLIMAISVLLLLSTFAISFTRLSVTDRRTVTSYVDSVVADIHGPAGIDAAIANLVQNFENDMYYRDYMCLSEDPDTPTDSEIILVDDDTSAGLSLEDLQVFNENNVNQPSITSNIIANRNVSAIIDNDHAYTLKVVDTSSLININSDIAFLEDIIQNLADAIEMRRFGPESKRYIFTCDKQKLAELIVANRPAEGYQTKDSIIGLTDNNNIISNEDFIALKDFITVFPLPEEKSNPFFRQIVFSDPDNLGKEVESFIPSVNINTASWPVLYAMIKGISISQNVPSKANVTLDEPDKKIAVNINVPVEITSDDAARLANRICEKRRKTVFKNYSEVIDFIEEVKSDVFTAQDFADLGSFVEGSPDSFSGNEQAQIRGSLGAVELKAKADAVKTNFDMIVSKTKPVYSSFKKSNLGYHTIAFGFFPGGHFEISCLVQAFLNNTPVVAKKYYSNVRIFSVEKFDTQEDFEKVRILQNGEVTNSFSSPNNLLNNQLLFNGNAKTSNNEGVIDPIQFNSKTGYAPIDQPDPEGNYLFRADFNGSLVPNKSENNLAQSFDSVDHVGEIENSGGVFDPPKNSALKKVDLSAEGFVLKQDDNPEKLVYSDHTTTINNNNFLLDDRSIMFWFKISKDWELDGGPRTIFFSNSNFIHTETDDEGVQTNFAVGIQREIQVRVTQPDIGEIAEDDKGRKRRKRGGKNKNAASLMRQVELSLTNTIYAAEIKEDKDGDKTLEVKDIDKTNLPPEFQPRSETNTLTLNNNVNIRSEEFYHLAMRWQNGISIPDVFAVLTGQFYDDKGIPLDFFQQKNTDSANEPEDDKDDKGIDLGIDLGLGGKDKSASFRADFVGIDEDENKMYIGEPGSGDKPEATMDDIRITTDINWIDDATFLPSRYELKQDENSSFFGEFQMQIDVPGSNKVLFVVPEITRVNNKVGQATNASNLQTPIIDDRSKIEDLLDEHLGISVENFANLDNLLTDTSLTLEVKTKQRKKGKRKEIRITKDNKKVFSFSLEVPDNIDIDFTASGQSLLQSVKTYLINVIGLNASEINAINVDINNNNPASEFQAIIPDNVPGEPLIVNFRFQRMDQNPIFQSPVLDRVTFAYLGKPQILEYRVLGR